MRAVKANLTRGTMPQAFIRASEMRFVWKIEQILTRSGVMRGKT